MKINEKNWSLDTLKEKLNALNKLKNTPIANTVEAQLRINKLEEALKGAIQKKIIGVTND